MAVLATVGGMDTQSKRKNSKWWRSGHLHNTPGGSKQVDFGDEWAEYFDAYARSYEANAFECLGLETVSRREVSAMLESLSLQKDGEVLEVGSGEGRLTRAMMRAGYKVQATDGAPGMVEVLNEKYPQTRPMHMLLDGQSLPFENSSFDAVAGLRVWKYVNNRNAVLAEMRRVTKTGGLLVLEWTSKNGVSRFGYKGANINLLDRVTVETELRSAGFDVVRHTTTTRIPQPFWRISSSERYISALNAVENTLNRALCRGAKGTLFSRSVVTVAKAA